MLTSKERRFMRYWEEQRAGSKWSYFLLYILAGSLICVLLTGFVFMTFFYAFPGGILGLVVFSLVFISCLVTINWVLNEKKFKGIIKREVDEAYLKHEERPR
jgi:hypothetical protein